MKRPGKLGAIVGIIALAIAVVGLSLSSATADPPPKTPKSDQGITDLRAGF